MKILFIWGKKITASEPTSMVDTIYLLYIIPYTLPRQDKAQSHFSFGQSNR